MNNIRLERIWTDDDGMVKLIITISNGSQKTVQDFYAYPDQLEAFAADLASYFPKLGKGEVSFKYGDKPDFYSLVFLRVFYIDLHTLGIEVTTDNREESPDAASSHFFMRSNCEYVNRMGESLAKWCSNMDTVFEYEWYDV